MVQTATLRVRQLLHLHARLEPTRLFPEQTLPRGEIRSLEERVFENTLDASESLDNISAIVVQVPELSIVTLMRPPEWILPGEVVLFERKAHPPALVVRQRVTILLEQGVDARNTSVPRVLEIFKR